jgi:pyruvate dehydrogenase E2 component (dihydrolipoamide acetyltransferase)
VDGRLIEQTRMRAAIARRMTDSKQQAPHFYVQTEVSMDALLNSLAQVNESDPPARVTATAAIAFACAKALIAHPRFNSIWTADGLLEVDEVNLGIAIALEEGLVAPALLGASALDVFELAEALHDLVDRGRSGKLRPMEMTDATFTLSNLGGFGVSAFAAIITPPQVATLATARPVQRCVLDAGVPVAASVMTATLSADHRVLDGADAARWLESFRLLLEEPASLFSEPAGIKERTR